MEYQVLWAPLSRKWQLWQRETEATGCTIETLLGEYPSEGRAAHQMAILQGELPPDAEYEFESTYFWFSPRRLFRPRRTSCNLGPDLNSDMVDIEADQPRPVAVPPAAGLNQGLADNTASEWRSGLLHRLEIVRRLAEQNEVEGVRHYLEEALQVVPRRTLEKNHAA